MTFNFGGVNYNFLIHFLNLFPLNNIVNHDHPLSHKLVTFHCFNTEVASESVMIEATALLLILSYSRFESYSYTNEIVSQLQGKKN